MRYAVLLLAPLLAACGGNDRERGVTAGGEARESVQTATLTGLYEAGGEARPRSRLCMTAEQAAAASFGIVVETPAGSCSGAGEALRTNGVVRLTMTGDGECSIDASVDGTLVTFPSKLAQGCAYYCAPGASLAGARFEKIGGTGQDAMRARDLAGDPLCEGAEAS